jgi:uncharacterized protein (TIGR00369 family)
MASTGEVAAFMVEAFPQARAIIERVGDQSSIVRFPIGAEDLRPGGTVSGPTMMALADTALYVAILGHIGIVPLAVTTHLNIDFLRRPAADRSLLAKCTLLKVGRTLAVGHVLIYSEGMDDPVAQATGSYAIPTTGTSGPDRT